MSNLDLWNRVETTDPEYTKVMPGAGLTAINASYTIKKATEVWGPIGDKWGYEIVDEKFVHGAPFFDDAGHKLADAMIHTLRLKLWYFNSAGGRCEVEHFGHTDMVYKNKYGIQTEREPSKKSLTDALSKCLSMLGFGGDVHLGMYDDHGYVDELGNKMAIEKSDDKAAEILRQEQEYRDWASKTEKHIETTVSLHELEAVYTAAIRKARRRDDKKAVSLFTKLTKEAKERLAKEEAA